LLIQQQNLKKK